MPPTRGAIEPSGQIASRKAGRLLRSLSPAQTRVRVTVIKNEDRRRNQKRFLFI
jgi:hypothetical protein